MQTCEYDFCRRPRNTTYQRDGENGEAGLDYAVARYYLSTSGRFMTADPGHVGADVGNPQSWNAYVYSFNDPINFTDPTGLCPPENDDTSDCHTISVTVRCGFWCRIFGPGGEGAGVPLNLGPCFDVEFARDCVPEGLQTAILIQPEPRERTTAPPVEPPQPPPPDDSFLDKLTQCASDQLGITDLLALGAIAAGQPIPGTKPFVIPGSSRGTSVAGKAADWAFGSAKLPVRLPTIVGGPGTGARLAIRGTKSVARFAGRAVPIVGWAILAYDAASIAVCTAR